MFKKIGVSAQLSESAEDILKADQLVLPGVGAFDQGMKQLKEKNLIPALTQRVLKDRIPILGICLGMQLFSKSSEEGSEEGLGWVDAVAQRFHFETYPCKVPHMGWGEIQMKTPHPLLRGMDKPWRFYFVHSYHVVCQHSEVVVATTHYGYSFTSMIAQDNILGVQFHPEKSHKFGMKLLQNFSEIK